MASEDALRKADFHRNVMKTLAMSQNDEVRQLAAALDSMMWHDASFTDLQGILNRVSQLESDLELANDRIRTLEIHTQSMIKESKR